ncbi:MAG: hypothetical protein H7039_12575, partial [Bryobacteraceae bacterium]|nr:hypothetical protein [Bryobacteraceae bacterium]
MIRLPALLAGAAVLTLAAGPDNVVIVVNSTSAISKNTGEYYARRRGIAASHVCSIPTTDAETIDRAAYTKLEAAVAGCLQSR